MPNATAQEATSNASQPSAGMNANVLRPPKPLMVDGDTANNWKLWLQQYEWYEIATQMSNKTAEVQVATLMSAIGSDAVRIYNTFVLTQAEKAQVSVIKEKFTNFFTPRANVTFERYTFNKMYQTNTESFDEFLTKVKSQSKKCEFGNLHDSLLKDKIIIGIANDQVRERLLTEEQLNLDKAIQVCRANEATNKQLKELQKTDIQVNTIKKVKQPNKYEKKNKNTKEFDCKRCGMRHGERSCPAYGKKCRKCNKNGHFQKMCRTNNKKSVRKVHIINENSDADTSRERNDYELSEITLTNKDNNKSWFEEALIGKKRIKFKLDSGAECNVLPKVIASSLSKEIDTSKTRKIVTFSKDKMQVIGELRLPICIRNITYNLKFLVVDAQVTPILGKEACEKSGLIVRVHEMKIDNEQEKEGRYKDFRYDIDLIDEPDLKSHPARQIPFALKNEVKAELDRMVKRGVIKPVTEATPCVSPMVVIKQKGKLRICLDPSDINKNIMRRYYPLKTLEEISANISGSKYFTLLDCEKGFWQISVTERTQRYLTFATPWGRYSYLVLPFGLSPAPEIFQEKITSILQDIKNVEVAMDDILIHSKTLQELRETQQLVIKRLTEKGLKLNKDKCVYEQTKVKFLGHIVGKNGVAIDPEKVKVINQLKVPKNKKEVQRLLGMLAYLTKFIKNMSHLTQPIRELIKDKVQFIWDVEQQTAFDNIKKVLSSTPVLKGYDVNSDVTIQTDASSYAVGSVLMQNEQPIAYATKALTQAQINYPQIEKEALAIKIACEKFHNYIYGKKLTIQTDHKPLESILKKPIYKAPARLQKILLSVIKYSPEVIYKKGKTLHIADTLSRDCEYEENNEEEELEVLSMLSITIEAMSDLQRDTQNDDHLKKLQKVILKGWPENMKELPEEIKQYHTFCDELSCYDNVLFKGQKIIIPSSQKKRILRSLHQGHYGIQRTLARARQQVFWIGMNKDIISYVENCQICQKTQRSKQQETLITKEIPTLPFEIVGTDIFYFDDKEYLLIADSYSGFFDFKILKNATAKEVISMLKAWFAVHGIPIRLESDGGPQYASKEFKEFTKDWQFNHIISSPRYPRSNGLSERFVQTAKNTLKKCKLDNSSVQLALLNYRNTPRNNALGSPNERLMGRVTRSTIPNSKDLYAPKIVKGINNELNILRQKQKHYYDRKANTSEPRFEIGDKIRMQRGPRDWIGATIVNTTDKPRSVIVQTKSGKRYRRNTIHLSSTKADINDQSPIRRSYGSSIPATNLTTEIVTQHATSQQPVVNEGTETVTNTTKSDFQPNTNKVTRSGRRVKPIIKLNL